jgi:hypothetical protein
MNTRQFVLETLSIFLGDVLATAFIALVAYVVWYVVKYPGFRVGANLVGHLQDGTSSRWGGFPMSLILRPWC